MQNNNNLKPGVNLFSLLVFLLISGCASNKSVSKDISEIVISQQRLECMGNCPVYSMNIFSDRKVKFIGEKNVPKSGLSTFFLTKEDFNAIISSFTEVDFFNLEEKYTSDISDGSTTYIYYKEENQEMKIMDYYGAPKRLKELEEKLESLIFSYLED